MKTRSRMMDRITSSTEGRLLWNQERTILDVTELICELMEQSGVSRSELARRLGKTKGYITQLLDGTTNMTVRTVSDVFTVLGHEFRPTCKRMDSIDGIKFTFDVQVGEDDFPSNWDLRFQVSTHGKLAVS